MLALSRRIGRSIQAIKYSKYGNLNTKKNAFFSTPLEQMPAIRGIFQQTSDDPWLQTYSGRLLAMAIAICGIDYFSKETEMLGIAGVVGSENAQEFLLSALHKMTKGNEVEEVGIATLSPKIKIVATTISSNRGKDAASHWLPESFDCVEALRNNIISSNRHANHSIGIARSLEVTNHVSSSFKASVQPQCDSKRRVAIVHEGTIINAKNLRQELVANSNIEFRSHTDAALIAEMISMYLDKGMNVSEACKQTLSKLEGSWAVAVLCTDNPNEIFVAQKGSRLAIGIGDKTMYISSDPVLFADYTNRYISLNDREFAVVSSDCSKLDLSRTEDLLENNKNTRHDQSIASDPYRHFTLREICEQPESITRALGGGSRMSGDTVILGGLDTHAESMLSIRHLILAAQGSSLNASQFASKLMKEVGAFDSVQVVPCSAVSSKYLSGKHAGVCVVSKNGESKDGQTIVKRAKKAHVPVFSVINAVGSQVARMTKIGVYLNAGDDRSKIATRSFTSQVTVLALIASWYGQYRDDVDVKKRLSLVNSLNRLSLCFENALLVHHQCKIIAQRLFSARHCFLIGSGFGAPIAQQGALLLTCMAHLHTEGGTIGSVQHGILSLIEGSDGKHGRTPVIIIILKGDKALEMRKTAEQVRARGAYTIVITDDPTLAENVSDVSMVIPENGMLTALSAIVPLQLLAYELGVLRGLNPDKSPLIP